MIDRMAINAKVSGIIEWLRKRQNHEGKLAMRSAIQPLEERLNTLEQEVQGKADTGQLETLKKKFEKERHDLEKKAKDDRIWSCVDSGVALIIVLVAFCLTFRVFSSTSFILDHLNAISGTMAKWTAAGALFSAIFSLVFRRFKMTSAVIAVLLATVSLGNAIYNPDSPKLHRYWEGAEIVYCSDVTAKPIPSMNRKPEPWRSDADVRVLDCIPSR